MTKNSTQTNQEEFIMLPTVDYCFKELMQNGKVRKGIISALLDLKPEEIDETILLPTILRKEYPEDKYGILDVLVKLKNGTKIDFEMQVEQVAYWPNRVIFYLSKMYTDQIQEGEGYDALQKCIHVSILDFVHFPEDDRCFRKIGICDLKTGEVYTDLLEIHVLELGKLPPEDKNESGIIRWMRFLGGKRKEDFRKMAEKDEYIGTAYECLEHLSADEEKRLEYESRQKALRDYNTWIHGAKEQGREEGIRQMMYSVIKNMYSQNKSIEEIAESIGCSQKEVEKVIEELHL